MKAWKHFLMLVSAASVTFMLQAQVTHYVKPNGTCNNSCTTSFANAYGSLQSAIAAASAGDTILVAAGTYKPTAGSDRTASFNIPGGLSLFGGFEGLSSELYSTQSQPDVYTTILSGEIGTASDTDNSYHVVTVTSCSDDVTLHGFVIEQGNANHPLTNVNRLGGGLRYHNDTGAGTLRVAYCTFRNNQAAKAGGGLHAVRGGLRIDHCTFQGNTQTGTLSILDYGGAGCFLWSTGLSMDAQISNSRFIDNTMYCRAALGMSNAHGIIIYNTVFTGNHNTGLLAGSGAAIYGHNAHGTRIVNCTFAGNQTDALLAGKVIDCSPLTTDFDIRNSIIWGNIPSAYHPVSAYADDVVHCDIENLSTWAGPQGSTAGTICADPLVLTGDGHLSAFSPCVDAGLDTYITGLAVTDIRGEDRIADQDCSGNDNADMGAFEVQEGENQRIHVSPGGTGSNGFGWNTAYPSLKEGIALAADCHSMFCDPQPEIWVGEGTYTPGAIASETFLVQESMSIYGGFAGTEEHLDERPVYTLNPATVSGDLGGGNHSHHLFAVDGTALTVDGFYLSGAHAANASGGAFMLYNNANLTLRNAVVHDNVADHEGGGIHSEASALTCEAVVFENNQATNGGAIATYDGGTVTLQDCTLETNTANLGGAVYAGFNAPQLTVTDALFSGNSAVKGGALCLEGGTGSVNGSTFYGNEATEGGALCVGSGAQIGLYESTFELNGSAEAGGALHLYNAVASAANCTLSANTGNRGGAVYAAQSELVFELGQWDNNAADTGGAIYIGDQCTMTIRNAKAYRNTSTGNGGFICNNGMSDIYLGNLYVIGNTAGGDGGVFSAEKDSSDFYMANIVGLCNSADGGGNVYYSHAQWSAMELYFGSFYANTHPDGISSDHTVIKKTNSYTTVHIANSNFYQNQDRTFCGSIFVAYTNTDGLSNCNGTYLGSPYPVGIFNINADPAFIDLDGPDNILCTWDDHVRVNGNGTIGGNSPCIDAGSTDALHYPKDFADVDNDSDILEALPIDIDANPRIDNNVYDSIPDVGAYENNGSYKRGGYICQSNETVISVYPNPTVGQITIILNQPVIDVKLYDIRGALQPTMAHIDGVRAVLNLEHLIQGIYMLEVVGGTRIYQHKLEKM